MEPYLMQSENECKRLVTKFNPKTTQDQLLKAKLHQLKAPPHVLNAGSGPGLEAQVICEILAEHYGTGTVSLLDLSYDRLSYAQKHTIKKSEIQVNYLSGAVQKIPLLDNSVDFVFARFLFEYLSKPQIAFDELLRVLKPGGKLVIGDLDNNSLIHYPVDKNLEAKLIEVLEELNLKLGFDPHAGRKLYHLFHKAALENIQIHFEAHNLFYGNISESDSFNWLQKINQITKLQKEGAIKLSFDMASEKDVFASLVLSPGQFSYSPFIMVEGEKSYGNGKTVS